MLVELNVRIVVAPSATRPASTLRLGVGRMRTGGDLDLNPFLTVHSYAVNFRTVVSQVLLIGTDVLLQTCAGL